MSDNLDLVRSRLPDMAWPMMPDSSGALALAVAFQFGQCEWWSLADLECQQAQQLGMVLDYAWRELAFWRERLAATGYRPGTTPARDTLSALPLLTRKEIRNRANLLVCRDPPPRHGRIFSWTVADHAGGTVNFHATETARIFRRACTLREHLWQQRDFAGKHAVICAADDFSEERGWGVAATSAFQTGPVVELDAGADAVHQLEWLQAENPDYLTTYPPNLLALARHGLASGARPPRLRQVRTLGLGPSPELRELSRRAWDVPLAGVYTRPDLGPVALQCPQHEHYHLQAEHLLVELLDADNHACVPGQRGRVVVTTLHNFAMPLIRYETGDSAEMGAPCPCGRQLPVIRCIAAN